MYISPRHVITTPALLQQPYSSQHAARWSWRWRGCSAHAGFVLIFGAKGWDGHNGEGVIGLLVGAGRSHRGIIEWAAGSGGASTAFSSIRTDSLFATTRRNGRRRAAVSRFLVVKTLVSISYYAYGVTDWFINNTWSGFTYYGFFLSNSNI